MEREVTVVIPGRDCARTLPRCLAALTEFLNLGQIAEIIFVNDGSLDASADVAEQAGARVIYCPRLGPGAARNLGWRAARTPLVWFVDSDCVAEPDALTLLLETRSALTAQAVGGSYSNAQDNSWVAQLIHLEMVERHRAIGVTSNFAITANLLCERAVLEKLDGFDESFQLAQDLDLSYRIVDAGHVLGFNSTSRVAHFHETKLLRYLYKQARQGYWRMKLYAKHPGRASGDKYSGLLDYAQPPLAMLALGGILTSAVGAAFNAPVLAGASLFVAGGATVTVLLLQVPMAARIRGAGRLHFLTYVPFGSLRAGARGLGMCAGIAAVLKLGLSPEPACTFRKL